MGKSKHLGLRPKIPISQVPIRSTGLLHVECWGLANNSPGVKHLGEKFYNILALGIKTFKHYSSGFSQANGWHLGLYIDNSKRSLFSVLIKLNRSCPLHENEWNLQLCIEFISTGEVNLEALLHLTSFLQPALNTSSIPLLARGKEGRARLRMWTLGWGPWHPTVLSQAFSSAWKSVGMGL